MTTFIEKDKFNELVKKRNIANNYKKKAKAKRQVEAHRKLAKNDIIYRIVNNLSVRVVNCFRKDNIKFKFKHLQLLGCNYETLKNHLNSLFTEGMSFDNYGKWELDHIIPVSKFNLNNVEEVKKCFNYINLQPLWKIDNIIKSNKLIT